MKQLLQNLRTGEAAVADVPVPMVQPGDDLCALLIAALARHAIVPERRDILVVTSKIVSKAEGRYRDLAGVEPSTRARELAQITNKDVRLVEAVLEEAATRGRRGGIDLAHPGATETNRPQEGGPGARRRATRLQRQISARSQMRAGRRAWSARSSRRSEQ